MSSCFFVLCPLTVRYYHCFKISLSRNMFLYMRTATWRVLRGVIYYGGAHFTARWISNSGVVWFHDGMAMEECSCKMGCWHQQRTGRNAEGRYPSQQYMSGWELECEFGPAVRSSGPPPSSIRWRYLSDDPPRALTLTAQGTKRWSEWGWQSDKASNGSHHHPQAHGRACNFVFPDSADPTCESACLSPTF